MGTESTIRKTNRQNYLFDDEINITWDTVRLYRETNGSITRHETNKVYGIQLDGEDPKFLLSLAGEIIKEARKRLK